LLPHFLSSFSSPWPPLVRHLVPARLPPVAIVFLTVRRTLPGPTSSHIALACPRCRGRSYASPPFTSACTPPELSLLRPPSLMRHLDLAPACCSGHRHFRSVRMQPAPAAAICACPDPAIACRSSRCHFRAVWIQALLSCSGHLHFCATQI
jgi:hypothetical protein